MKLRHARSRHKWRVSLRQTFYFCRRRRWREQVSSSKVELVSRRIPESDSTIFPFFSVPYQKTKVCLEVPDNKKKPSKNREHAVPRALLSTLDYGPFVTHGISGNDACLVSSVLFVFENCRRSRRPACEFFNILFSSIFRWWIDYYNVSMIVSD